MTFSMPQEAKLDPVFEPGTPAAAFDVANGEPVVVVVHDAEGKEVPLSLHPYPIDRAPLSVIRDLSKMGSGEADDATAAITIIEALLPADEAEQVITQARIGDLPTIIEALLAPAPF